MVVIDTDKFQMNISIISFHMGLKGNYNVDTSLRLMIRSGSYSGETTMNINLNQFQEFLGQLKDVRKTDRNECRLDEAIGGDSYLCIKHIGGGQFIFNGILCSNDPYHKLIFENVLDIIDLDIMIRNAYIELKRII